MRKSPFTEAQIIGILKEAEGRGKAPDLAREYMISAQTIYDWRAKYGGLLVSEAKWLKQLKAENNQLKQMVADLSLDHRALKSARGDKWLTLWAGAPRSNTSARSST